MQNQEKENQMVNSRPIRFRAWNNDLNLMQFGSERWQGVLLDDANDHGYPVMQFTGLKDKNGNPIYEGDIVNLTNDSETGAYTTIEVKWFRNQCGFNVNGNCEGDYEIIGNIYENPELLKGN